MNRIMRMYEFASNKRISLSAVCSFVIMLILGGCASVTDADEAMPIPRDIKILISGNLQFHMPHHTLIHITNGNVLEHTTFFQFGPILPEHEESYAAIASIASAAMFDNTLLNDFVSGYGQNVIATIDIGWEHRVSSHADRVLSQRQLNNIWELTANVVSGGSEMFYGPGEGFSHFVWAIIDGEMYWSLYGRDVNVASSYHSAHLMEFINMDLVLLTYYFIDLLPSARGF